MDARIEADPRSRYALVNRETGAVEASGLRRQDAREVQNRLWSRGIKTSLREEVWSHG